MGMEIIRKWEPDDFELETNTIWSFPERGTWATHDGGWRGNWSPYIPRNLILRYTQEGDWVLDQFVGGGTTIVEAKLLNRNSIGIDVNDSAIERCKQKISFQHPGAEGKVYLQKGDARKIDFVKSGSIDLICMHPPYADIIQYSENIEADLSLLSENDFLCEMRAVAAESFRVLKDGKHCAVLMGDIRENGFIRPLSYEVMKIFEDAGFRLKEMIIKEQHNCHSTKYWNSRGKINNFLLIAHEHLFVFKK